MLRVTVELVPFGVEADKRTLGTMTIANVGGTEHLGTYEAVIADDAGHTERVVVRYFRRQALSAWALVHEVLTSIADRDRRPIFLRGKT